MSDLVGIAEMARERERERERGTVSFVFSFDPNRWELCNTSSIISLFLLLSFGISVGLWGSLGISGDLWASGIQRKRTITFAITYRRRNRKVIKEVF